MLDDKKDLWKIVIDGPGVDTSVKWLFEGSPYSIKCQNFFPYQFLDVLAIEDGYDGDLIDWMNEYNCPIIFMNKGNLIEDYKNRAPIMK